MVRLKLLNPINMTSRRTDTPSGEVTDKNIFIFLFIHKNIPCKNSLVNTIKGMSSRPIYLTTLFMGRLCPLSSLPVCVHIFFARNWYLPFLNQPKGANNSRKYSTKDYCWTWRGQNPRLPDHLLDAHQTKLLRQWTHHQDIILRKTPIVWYRRVPL